MDDLKRAFDALKAKNAGYASAFQYADGQQPLQYSTQRLKEAFRDLTTSFSQNWVSVVLEWRARPDEVHRLEREG